MDEGPAGRFEVVVEQGVPHGDLYELEQTTCYRVIDAHSGTVVLTFQGQIEAALSRDTGLWEDYRLTGVSDVALALDGRSAIVTYHDGRVQTVPLPE
jgi:hypothetical protein